MIMETKDRIEKAVELFKSGYNCSQSVVGAFADMYGFTEEQAFRMSASFGGGIGRMRQTCGAACGMFLLAGLEKGAVEGKDREGKLRWLPKFGLNTWKKRPQSKKMELFQSLELKKCLIMCCIT